MNPKARVLVVTYNSATTIDGMLESLEIQHDHLSSVVVVDNGSSDDTVPKLLRASARFPVPLICVQGTNIGFAAGIREAATRSPRADYPALILNPDVQIAEGTIAMMLGVLHGGVDGLRRPGIVTAPLVLTTGDCDSASERRLPNLTMGAFYAILGRLTPTRFRYNALVDNGLVALPHERSCTENAGCSVHEIEATTGALMLISQAFRTGPEIFDTDYWMYGEDLQLCADAGRQGFSIVMVDMHPSLHDKGTSSGWPRSRRSNIEFHRAMYIYYKKNLEKSFFIRPPVAAAILLRLLFSLARGGLANGLNSRSW